MRVVCLCALVDDDCCMLCVVRCVLFAVRRSLFAVRCLRLVVRYSLLFALNRC